MENEKYVGKHKTFEEAQVIVNQFLQRHAERFSSIYSDELINGYSESPFLETTRRGNRRWVIWITTDKPLDEMSEQEKGQLFGKTFKRMPIKYQSAHFRVGLL